MLQTYRREDLVAGMQRANTFGAFSFSSLERILAVQARPKTAWEHLARNPAIPRDLETICLKAMAKRPAERYADCHALAEDLRRWLADEPILARPIGPLERAWRWCRRNPVVAALSLLVALSMVVGTVVSSSLAAVATDRAEEALNERTRADAERRHAEEERKDALAEKARADAERRRAEEQLLRSE